MKKQCQREHRQAFNNYISSLVDPNNSQVTKRLWPYIKSKKQDHTGIGSLIYQDTTITDAVGKTNVLAEYFLSVFTCSNASSSLPRMNSSPLPDVSPITIHHEGVAQLLLNIQPDKASGPDNLPARFLKEVANQIAPELSIVFQAYLDQGYLPDIWKIAEQCPYTRKEAELIQVITDQYHLF